VTRVAIALTATYLVVFALFYSQEILLDSSACEISCGKLVLDLALIFATPVTFVAALASLIAALVGKRMSRVLGIICLATLGATLVLVLVVISVILIRAT
jgi:hypothetical protein